MKNMLTVSLQEIDVRFGVYHGKAVASSKSVCNLNDKKFSRFFYVLGGEIIFNKNTKDELRAPAGTIVYLPNDITYFAEWTEEEGEYISINFILEEFYVKLSDKLCIAAIDSNKAYFKSFNDALNIWNSGLPGYKLELLSEIYKILHNLFLELTYTQIKSNYKAIYKGIIYLENHYLEDITIKQLADMCNMSENNFRRYFKKYKNMSPVTYRNYLRIQKSKELIQTGEYNISEAAEAVNITDICYYHKLFKKFYNTTPGEFKPQ